MQKKIIALAVIAAAFSAPAFADVTMYGVVDAAVAHVAADGVKGDILAVSGGLSQSRIGAKSVEDIGNGMKVVAVLEYGLDAQSFKSDGTLAASPATAAPSIGTARQAMLAVAGDFGTVATGYLQTAAYDQASMFDPAAGSAVSALQAVTAASGFLNGSKAIAARAPRALAYISPNLGGATLAWNYTTDALGGLGNATGPNDTKYSAYLLSAAYAAGPVAASFVYTNESHGGTSIDKEWSAGASYDLGMVKLFGTYQNNTPAVGSASKAYSMSAVAPVGPGAIAASYAANKLGSGAKGNAITLAYLQGLSKTVTAYAAFEHASNTGAGGVSVDNAVYGAGMNGASTLIAVGLNKKF